MDATKHPNLSDVLSRLDLERRQLVRAGERAEVSNDVVRLGALDGSWRLIALSALTEQTADAAIEREIAHHRSLNADFEWKVFAHDTPVDLLDRLRRRGFDIGPCEAVMVYDLADGLPATGESDGASDGLRVARLDDRAELPIFRRVAEAVFGKDYALTAGQLEGR